MRRLKSIAAITASVGLAALSSGCVQMDASNAQSVSVDTGFVGEIAPGTREWLSWYSARKHCEKYGKSSEIVDLKGSLAIYKCVADKK
jgi:hypothetical protein